MLRTIVRTARNRARQFTRAVGLRDAVLKVLPAPPGKPPSPQLRAKLDTISSFIRFLKGQESPRYPLAAFLEVSNLCNLRCVMCNVFSDVNLYRKEFMSSATCGLMDEKILDSVEGFLDHLLFVHLFGYGEPTLHPHFQEIVRRVSQSEAAIDFYTHGQNVTDELADFLVAQGVYEITVSFTGATKSDYESVYHNGSFEKALAGLAHLRDSKAARKTKYPTVVVNSIAFQHHLDKFDRFVELMVEHGVQRIHLTPLFEQTALTPALAGHAGIVRAGIEAPIVERAIKIGAQAGVAVCNLCPTAASEDEYRKLRAQLTATRQISPPDEGPLPIEEFKNVARQLASAPKREASDPQLREILDRQWDLCLDLAADGPEEIRKKVDMGRTPLAHDAKGEFFCHEPFKTMYIRRNGFANPCCNYPHYACSLGNVALPSAEQVWQGAGFETVRTAILNGEYPLAGCTECLKRRSGPQTHDAGNTVREYFKWCRARFGYALPADMAEQIIDLGEGQAIVNRFRRNRPELFQTGGFPQD